MAEIAAIYRYPVKGLSAERLGRVTVAPDETLPCDRAYAIENGSRDFDPEAPKYYPKTKFLMLMRDERLATLSTRYDEATATLTIERNGRQLAKGKLDTVIGRQIIEQFLATYMKDSLRGPPRIVTAPGFSFSDVPMKVVSILNMASVTDLARVAGKPVDPIRFRANFHLEGLEPWEEKKWLGRTMTIGGATFEVVKDIVRCPATNVNPSTAERDMNLPRTLEQAFGANLMGIYARVVTGGDVATGDRAELQ